MRGYYYWEEMGQRRRGQGPYPWTESGDGEGSVQNAVSRMNMERRGYGVGTHSNPGRREGLPSGGATAAAACAAGAKADLEFDHIIPLAMGRQQLGAQPQILCATCNRAKGASLV